VRSVVPIFALFGLSACATQVGPTIPYRITWQHTVGSGYTRVVLIAPQYRNDSSIRSLGTEFVALTSGDGFAMINVFDDNQAADDFPRAMDLQGAEADYYDKHHVATYTRNTRTGEHELAITLNGPNGPDDIVKY
jgi:hypothetical protein